MKKKDWILIFVVLCVAASAYLAHYFLRDTGKGEVIVEVNGKLNGTYSLNEDQEITINQGSNLLEIKNGKANMIEADCPDQLCVHQRAVSASNENIICLPNKVVVEIRSKGESQIDAVTN